jgi:hypothetical protein
MRYRIRELLEEHHITAYRLTKLVNGEISPGTIYEWQRENGHVETFDSRHAEVLMDVFKCGPGELFAKEPRAKWPPPRGEKQKKREANKRRRGTTE